MDIQSIVGKQYVWPEAAAPHHLVNPVRLATRIALVDKVVRERGAVRLLEVGSWCGASAVAFAEAISRLVPDSQARAKSFVLCLDIWRPYFSEADVQDEWHYAAMDAAAKNHLAYDVFCHNTSLCFEKFGVRIDHVRARSQDFLPLLAPCGFDIVYLDGSHYYTDVLADIAHAEPLLADNGILCGDDLEIQFSDADPELVRANLGRDRILDPRTGAGFHPGVTLAVGERLGRVAAVDGCWFMQRRGQDFEAPILADIRLPLPSYLNAGQKQQVMELVAKHMAPG